MAVRTRTANLDLQTALDGMEQAVLVFAADGALLVDNLAARRLFGPELAHLRAEGWARFAGLVRAGQGDAALDIDAARTQSLKSANPVHFSTRLGGVHVPGAVAALYERDGAVLLQVCMQPPDWTPLTALMDTLRAETHSVISATRGHADLITKLLHNRPEHIGADALAAQVAGLTEIVGAHMFRLDALMNLFERMEAALTGRLYREARRLRRRVRLDDWLEDFLDDTLDETLVDPEAERSYDHERFALDCPPGLDIAASPAHLRNVLRDLLSNAVLYSEDETPIMIQARAAADGRHARIDVIDRGYGIRAREADRVFAPFQRARQPQIISQFGYGLSLYVARAEVEAMGGRIWFDSEEGMGSTFSIKLPLWDEARHRRDEDNGDNGDAAEGAYAAFAPYDE